MEPSIEIATLVVSYLWALRDLFLGDTTKSRLGDFSSEKLRDDIYGAVDGDIAAAIRLRDLASRAVDERWSLRSPSQKVRISTRSWPRRFRIAVCQTRPRAGGTYSACPMTRAHRSLCASSPDNSSTVT